MSNGLAEPLWRDVDDVSVAYNSEQGWTLRVACASILVTYHQMTLDVWCGALEPGDMKRKAIAARDALAELEGLL
jgi:hypothetical protein